MAKIVVDDNLKLKPCPFCKDGGKPERRSFEHFVGNPSNGIVGMEDWVTCIICGASADTHVWSQRAERTCKNTAYNKDDFCCSECGAYAMGAMIDDFDCSVPIGRSFSKCPNCGKRVVE